MKQTKPLLICLMALTALLFTQCGKNTSPAEAAMASAQECYDHLLAGEYAGFLAGRADADSLPAEYREQLLVSYKQFRLQQEKSHGGIQGITAIRALVDTLSSSAQVFMMINFSDEQKEVVVVPMVEREGKWQMK